MRINNYLQYIYVLLIVFLSYPKLGNSQDLGDNTPFEIGNSVSIQSISEEMLNKTKINDITTLQISLNSLIDKEGNQKLPDTEIISLANKVRSLLHRYNIKAGAFHMPYGQFVDLSLINEEQRRTVVNLHRKLLRLCAPIQPEIVLFHPSWYLSLNEREEHKSQLIKSIEELVRYTRELGAVLVVENMTGPELHVSHNGVEYERPLFRTADEMINLLNRMPDDVYGAVDLNHITNPEKLIIALGDRLKFIHVADGDGENERHFFPCSGKGENNWVAIFEALYKVGYTGPFMYECHYKDLNDLLVCFKFMYNEFLLKSKIIPKY